MPSVSVKSEIFIKRLKEEIPGLFFLKADRIDLIRCKK